MEQQSAFEFNVAILVKNRHTVSGKFYILLYHGDVAFSPFLPEERTIFGKCFAQSVSHVLESVPEQIRCVCHWDRRSILSPSQCVFVFIQRLVSHREKVEKRLWRRFDC